MAVLKKAWMARQARAAGDQETAAPGPPCAVRRGSVAALYRMDLVGCAEPAGRQCPWMRRRPLSIVMRLRGLRMAEAPFWGF